MPSGNDYIKDRHETKATNKGNEHGTKAYKPPALRHTCKADPTYGRDYESYPKLAAENPAGTRFKP